MFKESLPLVWVHLGGHKPPKYLVKGIANARIIFPEVEIVLITDYDEDIDQLKKINVVIHKIEDPDRLWSQIKSALAHDMNFRGGFWFYSLARLLALHHFLKTTNYQRLIHIESDVLLLRDFPLNYFQEMKDVIAFSFQGKNQGIATILFIGSEEIAAKLASFISESVLEKSSHTDMTLLACFAQKEASHFVELPTHLDEIPITNREEVSAVLPISSIGLFDSISVGQYLFGLDPRNSRGVRHLYHQDASHKVNPSNWKYVWSDEHLYIAKDGTLYPIYNLHIHSKDLRCFSRKSFQKLMRSRLNKRNESRYEIVWSTMFKSLIFALRRRVISK